MAVLRRVCGFFGVPEPLVYVSPLPGHAHVSPLPGHEYGHGAVRIAEQSLVDLADDEVEALIAHLCGHLMLPGLAGELSADRAAAVYHGSADPITRVIFAESAEEFRVREERAARNGSAQAGTAEEFRVRAGRAARNGSAQAGTAEEFRVRAGRAARTDRHNATVHSGPSPEDLTVRVREIQAWTATPGFARLAFPGPDPAGALASPV